MEAVAARGYGYRSMTASQDRGDYPRTRTPVSYPSMEEQLAGEPVDYASRSGDSITVAIRFRPLRVTNLGRNERSGFGCVCIVLLYDSERECQRGDEIAWYADGNKIVPNEYNPMTAYAFDKVFGPTTETPEVYEVAAQPVVKAAMEGINGRSRFTWYHTIGHKGCIIIQDVINDLLDPTGQNLHARVDSEGYCSDF